MAFLSHTGKDRNTAIPFTQILSKELWDQMIPHFVDWEGISEGEHLDSAIRKNVEDCPIFVCVLTSEYTKRYYCMLELDLAIANQRKIIPVYIDNSDAIPDRRKNERYTNFMNEFYAAHSQDERISEVTLVRWVDNLEKLTSLKYTTIDKYTKGATDQLALSKKVVTKIKKWLRREMGLVIIRRSLFLLLLVMSIVLLASLLALVLVRRSKSKAPGTKPSSTINSPIDGFQPSMSPPGSFAPFLLQPSQTAVTTPSATVAGEGGRTDAWFIYRGHDFLECTFVFTLRIGDVSAYISNDLRHIANVPVGAQEYSISDGTMLCPGQPNNCKLQAFGSLQITADSSNQEYVIDLKSNLDLTVCTVDLLPAPTTAVERTDAWFIYRGHDFPACSFQTFYFTLHVGDVSGYIFEDTGTQISNVPVGNQEYSIVDGSLVCSPYDPCKLLGGGYVTIENNSPAYNIQLTTNVDFSKCEVEIVRA